MAGRRDGPRARVRLTLQGHARIYRLDVLERDVDAVLAREGADLLRVDRLRKKGRPSTA